MKILLVLIVLFLIDTTVEESSAAEGRLSLINLVIPRSFEDQNHHCVALTFDDGPDRILTPQLLDDLKRYDVRATFFLVGKNVARNASIVQRMVTEGHEIGAHSWAHDRLIYKTPSQLAKDFEQTSRAISLITHIRPVLFRPPYGIFNKLVQRTAIAKSYKLTQWDIDTLDWQLRNTNAIIQRILSKLRNGSIILLHDIHQTTIRAVPEVVKVIRSRGYLMVTVSELDTCSDLPKKEASQLPALY